MVQRTDMAKRIIRYHTIRTVAWQDSLTFVELLVAAWVTIRTRWATRNGVSPFGNPLSKRNCSTSF